MSNKINQDIIDEYYRDLYDKASSPVKKKNLKIIYNILIDQYKSSDNNFSIAHIGRLSKKQGGPIAQAIRNTKGRDYKDLIKFFEDNVTITNSNKTQNKEYNLSDYIEDPALKAHINITLAENKSLRNQLNILKENMHKNYQLNYIDNESEENNINKKLLSTELEAIKKFLNNIEQNTSPLYLSNNESIKDENGTLIANPGFYCALKKIMK